MKTRQGFVSNSSSSSFIIAGKKDTIKIKVELEYNTSNLIEFKTLQEFYDYQLEECSNSKEDTDEYFEDQIPKMKEEFAKGNFVYIGRVSTDDCDDLAGITICNKGLPKSNTYVILQDSEF